MKKIVVVGVGALGSHLVQFIRNVGAEIRVVDFDRIEQKNVLSQFHARSSVGKNKTQALQQTMGFLFGGAKLDTIPHRLTEDNVDALLKGFDLVIDCLDNGASRKIVQAHVRARGTPCLHGALSAADGSFGRVVWDEAFVIDDEAGAGAATCENGDQLPFIGIVSTFMAQAVAEFIRGGRKVGYSISPGGAVRI